MRNPYINNYSDCHFSPIHSAHRKTTIMAATSMAAALAATLPAPSAAPAAVATSQEAIPASMAKLIDIEAEIPLNYVQLDGMVSDHMSSILLLLICKLQVVTKILKHAREAPSTAAHGLLLGLDLDGVLEVSNSFSLPHHSGDEDDKSTKSIGLCRRHAICRFAHL